MSVWCRLLWEPPAEAVAAVAAVAALVLAPAWGLGAVAAGVAAVTAPLAGAAGALAVAVAGAWVAVAGLMTSFSSSPCTSSSSQPKVANALVGPWKPADEVHTAPPMLPACVAHEMEEPLGPLKQRKPSEVDVKHSLKPLKWGQPTFFSCPLSPGQPNLNWLSQSSWRHTPCASQNCPLRHGPLPPQSLNIGMGFKGAKGAPQGFQKVKEGKGW